jgi:hypothetical protein
MSALRHFRIAAFTAAALLGATSAHAQLMDSLKGALGGGSGSSSSSGGAAGLLGSGGQASGGASSLLGGLGGQAMPSLDSVGTGNLTGVLGYCVKNNYLGGSAASSVQSQLLGKLGGSSQAQSDSGYQQGLSGILGGNSGQQVNLGGGGLKGEITNKVCEQVLKYGQSLL